MNTIDPVQAPGAPRDLFSIECLASSNDLFPSLPPGVDPLDTTFLDICLQGLSEECTPSTAPLDNPFLSEFTDIPSLLGSYDATSIVLDDLSESPSPAASCSSSSATDQDMSSSLPSPTPSPTTKTSSSPVRVDKIKHRRIKNNAASRVSRAKRRATNSSLFVREKELLKENARLTLMADEMEREADRLRALLVNKLSN